MEENSRIKINENPEKEEIQDKNKKRRKLSKNKVKNFLKKIDYTIKNKTIKSNIFTNNEKEKDNQKMKTIRNPGVDFFRIMSMYSVVVCHYLGFGKDFGHFPQFKRQLSFIHGIIYNHNNSFALISGIILYKTNKYSNLLYLWFQVLFYSVGIHKYLVNYKKSYYVRKNMEEEYYPLIFYRYWYFTTYFGMYLFLPVLNKGIASLTKYEFRLVIITTLFIFVFWRDYKNPRRNIFQLNRGKSVIWFLVFYLTGAYIGKYRVDYFGIKAYFYCFICLFIFLFFSYLYFKVINNEFYFMIGNFKIPIPIVLKRMLNEDCDSTLKIIQDITACLFFMQIRYNTYISKVICFTGPLVFSVFLIHANEYILINNISHIFKNVPKNISFNSLMNFVFLKSLKVFIICIFIDYFRYLFFSLIRLKKILIFLETKMKEYFS